MKKRGAINLADVLFWIAILILLIWAIVKSFFIHSEPWQTYLPASIAALLFAFSFWNKLGRYEEKINHLERGLTRVVFELKELKEIEKRLIKIETEHNMIIKNKRCK